jgi:excinuclease ABC subunit B
MGDQPAAIEKLTTDLKLGKPAACLLGATGTGKTFTMANVIARLSKPTLIISHNKTLAAQLYEELREFFPNNSVNYFVSYYDYYQPEAYIPQRDIYIEKDASRNDDLDQLRLAATSNILSAAATPSWSPPSPASSASARPLAYGRRSSRSPRGPHRPPRLPPRPQRDAVPALRDRLQARQFRVRGDAIEVWPAYEKFAVRIELFGDEIERIEPGQPHQRRGARRENAVLPLPRRPLRHARGPAAGAIAADPRRTRRASWSSARRASSSKPSASSPAPSTTSR